MRSRKKGTQEGDDDQTNHGMQMAKDKPKSLRLITTFCGVSALFSLEPNWKVRQLFCHHLGLVKHPMSKTSFHYFVIQTRYLVWLPGNRRIGQYKQKPEYGKQKANCIYSSWRESLSTRLVSAQPNLCLYNSQVYWWVFVMFSFWYQDTWKR